MIVRSSGETSKLAAEAWAIDQLNRGLITTNERLLFAEFAKSWWVWGECKYLEGKLARGKSISRSYADAQRSYLVHHILPAFKDRRLTSIQTADIEEWLLQLRKDSSLSPTTINHCLVTLKIMFKEAHRIGILPKNPAAKVEPLKESPKQKTILSREEVRALFTGDALNTVWGRDLPFYTMNLLAATTGMRMGEVQALQVQDVHPEFVSVVHSWDRKYGLKDPKRNSKREIPIPTITANYLEATIRYLRHDKPEDLVFSLNGRIPFGNRTILEGFRRALERIGITPEKRAARNLTFHGWRHWFNSMLREKIPDYKLQRLTGHRTIEMTEHYTHVRLEDFQDVRNLQDQFFA